MFFHTIFLCKKIKDTRVDVKKPREILQGTFWFVCERAKDTQIRIVDESPNIN